VTRAYGSGDTAAAQKMIFSIHRGPVQVPGL